MLTDEAFGRAARRLADMPGQTSSRISYRPAEDGYAVVDVAVAERPVLPRGPIDWAATAARFLVDREAEVAVPGGTGQGEVWEVSWRWWNNRPRFGLSFAMPRTGWMPGVWRVDASWEAQTYARPGTADRFRERRARAGLAVSDWLSGNLKYEINGGVDVWNGTERTISAGAGIQRRLFHDRLALFADANAWFGVAGARDIRGAGARAIYNSASADAARWLFMATGGVDAVSADAPLAVWPGAGEGHAWPALLRAHPLLDDGVIAGRRSAARCWLTRRPKRSGGSNAESWRGSGSPRLPIRPGHGAACRARTSASSSTSAPACVRVPEPPAYSAPTSRMALEMGPQPCPSHGSGDNGCAVSAPASDCLGLNDSAIVPRRMRINVVGGGPAGLYFSLLMKQADPQHEIRLFERDGPDDTFGWGIVFSDQTFAYLLESDQPSFDQILASCQTWDNVDVVHRGRKVSVHGNRFSGIARITFLQILQRELLPSVSSSTSTPRSRISPDCLRRTCWSGPMAPTAWSAPQNAAAFLPDVSLARNRYIWLGTPKLFHGLTLTFRETEWGPFAAHS